jgi:glutathione peroxidase
MGKRMHDMFAKRDPNYAKTSSIKWNFTKFLVNKKGKVVKRFEPTDKISDIEAAINTLLR